MSDHPTKRIGIFDVDRVFSLPKWARELIYTLEGKIARACAAIRIDAGHDSSGNPLRAYVVIHPVQGLIAAVPEGYYGRSCLDADPDRAVLRGVLPTPSPWANAPTFMVTRSEYRATVKAWGPEGVDRTAALVMLGVKS
jgi:hypothetical protein